MTVILLRHLRRRYHSDDGGEDSSVLIKEETADIDLGSRTLCGSRIRCLDLSDWLWVEIMGFVSLRGVANGGVAWWTLLLRVQEVSDSNNRL